MMSAICLGLMLVFEPKERNLMQRPPRDPRQPILTFPLFMRTSLVTLLIGASAFGAFLWEQEVRGGNVIEARTTVINVIVMVEIFYLLNCRSLLHSMFRVGMWSNLWIFAGIAAMLIAQLLFTHAPVMNRLFHTAPLDLASWIYITSVGFAAYCIVEFEKWVRRKVGHDFPSQQTKSNHTNQHHYEHHASNRLSRSERHPRRIRAEAVRRSRRSGSAHHRHHDLRNRPSHRARRTPGETRTHHRP